MDDRQFQQLADEVRSLKRELLNLQAGESQSERNWNYVASTATYVSATSFTVAGDHTGIFKLGTKFRCLNSTTKYGYVLSSTVAAGVTTVNLVSNTSYSLASGAITDVRLSYANPPDFPVWINYTPTITTVSGAFTTVSASGTFGVTVKLCYVVLIITITTNGTAVGCKASTPINTSGVEIIAGRESAVTGDLLQGIVNSHVVSIYDYSGAYINADGLTIYMSGAYRI